MDRLTVLLIDGVGRVREWAVPVLVYELLMPVYKPTSWAAAQAQALPDYDVAVFQLSLEPSYPPVYRWVRTDYAAT